MTDETGTLDLELARTVLRQGELRLQAHLGLAVAADQRAVTLTAMFAATALAALGFGASWIDGPAANVPLGIGAVVAGLAFAGAAGLCVWALRPMTFALAGAQPEKWWCDGVEARPLAECLRKESNNYQKRIEHNRRALARNAESIRRALRLACVAPILGLAVWALVRVSV